MILSVSKSVKSTATSFAFAVIPVPPITSRVTSPVVPPPVSQLPAVTAVMSPPPPPQPPEEDIVTSPPDSVIVTLEPATKVKSSDEAKVLPPAITVLLVTFAVLAVISSA